MIGRQKLVKSHVSSGTECLTRDKLRDSTGAGNLAWQSCCTKTALSELSPAFVGFVKPFGMSPVCGSVRTEQLIETGRPFLSNVLYACCCRRRTIDVFLELLNCRKSQIINCGSASTDVRTVIHFHRMIKCQISQQALLTQKRFPETFRERKRCPIIIQTHFRYGVFSTRPRTDFGQKIINSRRKRDASPASQLTVHHAEAIFAL